MPLSPMKFMCHDSFSKFLSLPYLCLKLLYPGIKTLVLRDQNFCNPGSKRLYSGIKTLACWDQNACNLGLKFLHTGKKSI